MLSDGNVEPLVLEPEFHAHELTIVASSDGKNYPVHAQVLFDYWRRTKAPLDKLFTWYVAAKDLPQTFEQILREHPLKVFVS